MFLDDTMMAQRHRDDITAAATARLARALRGSARARRRHLAADEQLERALHAG